VVSSRALDVRAIGAHGLVTTDGSSSIVNRCVNARSVPRDDRVTSISGGVTAAESDCTIAAERSKLPSAS
jgi:hypothetical protein